MHFDKAFKEFQYLKTIFDIPIVILGIMLVQDKF